MFEDNSLIIKKKSKRTDLKLTKTNILFLNDDFTVDKNGFIYTVTDNINIFTCNPFSKIYSKDYKNEIKEFLATEKGLLILNEDSLTLLGNNFNTFFDDLKNAKLVLIKHFKIENEIFPAIFGVIKNNTIQVFNENLHRIKIFEGQSVFYTEEYLAIGNLNTLTIYSNKIVKILVPNLITSIVGLKDQRKVFCSTLDNNIYSFEDKMGIMEYHTSVIKEMRISNEKYLYSNDGNKIVMWDIETEVAMGFINDDLGFDKMEIMDLSERSYDFNLKLI